MRKTVISFTFAMLAILVSRAQPTSYGVLYCLNPLGVTIPLLQAGSPAPTNYPGIQAYGMNPSNQAVALQCDINGNLIVAAIGTGTTNSFAVYTGTNSIGSVTTQQLAIANQQTNPATWLFVNGASIYAGTADGSPSKPYLTFGAAAAAMTGAGPYVIFMAPGNYTESGAISTGTAPHVIFGNDSTLTFSGGITVNAPASVYDLNTVGNVTYAYTGTQRSERHGGSYSAGDLVINGFVHWYGVQVTNTGGTHTVTVNGTLAGDFVTGGMQFKSGGASAFIALNNVNLQKASGYNFDMTSGGVLALNGGYLTTAAGTANIYAPTANSLATSHAIQSLTFVSGTGASFGAGTYYAYDNLSIDPVGALGFAFYRVGATSTHPAAAWYTASVNGTVIPSSATLVPAVTGYSSACKGSNGVACISLTNQSSAISTTTLFTTATAGQYCVAIDNWITTVGTAGTITVTVGANNGAGGSNNLYGTTGLSTTTLGGQQEVYACYHVAAGTAITYLTAFTGVTGSPVYSLDLALEWKQ